MSVLVVGLSHRTAPVAVLERAAVPVEDIRKTVEELHDAETGIDQAGASVVSVALDQARSVLGSLEGKTAVVVGAGSMGALSCATLKRYGVDDIVVANRSPERAKRLASSVGGRSVALDEV